MLANKVPETIEISVAAIALTIEQFFGGPRLLAARIMKNINNKYTASTGASKLFSISSVYSSFF